MAAERDLTRLLRGMRPVLNPGRFVFTTVTGRYRVESSRSSVPWAGPGLGWVTAFHQRGEKVVAGDRNNQQSRNWGEIPGHTR